MNIPTSIIVVLLVVAWLVVLVPMVARRRERVPQSEPAGANFRVLRRASASLRRRPGRGAKGRTMTQMDRPGDNADTETLVSVGGTVEPADAAEEWAAAQAASRGRAAATRPQPLTPQRGEQDAPPAVESSQQEGEPFGEFADLPLEESEAGTDRRFVQSIPDEIDEQEWADHVAAAPEPADPASFADVQAEQLRPVPRRPGRGGFDPEAAEATRAYRYQQRRRVTLILLIATVAFAVAALVMINWLWIGALISAALLVGYLAYLRRQVRIEAAIRQRRMERLQRARQIRPEYARPPRRTRGGMSAVAPGRTIVDLDDDDPSFDELEGFHEPMTYRRAAGQ